MVLSTFTCDETSYHPSLPTSPSFLRLHVNLVQSVSRAPAVNLLCAGKAS